MKEPLLGILHNSNENLYFRNKGVYLNTLQFIIPRMYNRERGQIMYTYFTIHYSLLCIDPLIVWIWTKLSPNKIVFHKQIIRYFNFTHFLKPKMMGEKNTC